MLRRLLAARRAGPLALALLHAAALAVFVRGFLLTRVHLDARATGPPALTPPPRTRLVWLLIDSLRYDFVVADGRYACQPGRVCHQRRMAYLANLTSQVGRTPGVSLSCSAAPGGPAQLLAHFPALPLISPCITWPAPRRRERWRSGLSPTHPPPPPSA